MRHGHGRPSLHARWVAAQRLRLERTRPSTPGGDLEAERRLSRAVAGGVSIPLGRSSALAQRTQVIDAEVRPRSAAARPRLSSSATATTAAALRFGGGSVRWFEVDRPAAQADKRRHLLALVIATTGTTYVGLDLLADALGPALQAAGHDAGAPSSSSPKGSSTR